MNITIKIPNASVEDVEEALARCYGDEVKTLPWPDAIALCLRRTIEPYIVAIHKERVDRTALDTAQAEADRLVAAAQEGVVAAVAAAESTSLSLLVSVYDDTGVASA